MNEHPFGYIIGNKIYLKSFLGQEDRVIGEVKEDEASTFRYFEGRFETVKQKVEKLKSDIKENQNKGSFLMKLIHLKSSLMTYDGLGDFPALIKELEEQEAYLEDIIQSNRQKNLEIKNELIQEAESYKDSTDWKETSEVFKELKLKWLKTGPVEKELEEEINKKFQDILDVFYGNRKNYFDGLALQAEQNIKIYESLLDRAREAYNMADVRTAFEISKRIQKEWKTSGRVPASKRQPIWDEFSKINNRIFSKYKRMSQNMPTISPGLMIKKIDRWAEEMRLLSKGEVNESKLNQAKKLQGEWKKLPPKKPRNAQQSIGSFVFFSEIIFEKSFLEKLCHSKYEGFAEMPEKEQKPLKINLLKDLIARDQRELVTVRENAENFRSQEGEFDHIMRKKIAAHKRKVDVKNSILKELTNN